MEGTASQQTYQTPNGNKKGVEGIRELENSGSWK
jgi:hypothetical protein